MIKTFKTDVLIIGAGLTGLSCAAGLEGKREYLLLESTGRPGGLSGSDRKGGFIFDYSGHLLHFHDPEVRKFILELLDGNVSLLKRDSRIWSHGVYTRYPFQANTYGLPPEVVSECVRGFLKSYLRSLRRSTPDRLGSPPGNRPHPEFHEGVYPLPSTLSFKEWALSVFGEGICRHFMFPYNAKLWRRPLSSLGSDWCAPFVPRPRPEDVIRGAYHDSRTPFGYNACFRYPIMGGIQSLADALTKKAGNILYNCRVESVDFSEKKALVYGLGTVRFNRLVSTMPLKRLIETASGGVPASVRRAGLKLKFTSLSVLNLGAEGRAPGMHWTYFHEKQFPFYRAGIYSNFSRHLAPDGACSYYIEFSHHGKPGNRRQLEESSIRLLRQCGMLGEKSKVVEKHWQGIDCAYAIYDREREPALKTINSFLRSRGAVSAGRYGAWKYSFMEEAIKDGGNCALQLCGTGIRETAPRKSELRPI
ncbi:MAG: FAD-dependent oxidoreductase [bacterium]